MADGGFVLDNCREGQHLWSLNYGNIDFVMVWLQGSTLKYPSFLNVSATVETFSMIFDVEYSPFQVDNNGNIWEADFYQRLLWVDYSDHEYSLSQECASVISLSQSETGGLAEPFFLSAPMNVRITETMLQCFNESSNEYYLHYNSSDNMSCTAITYINANFMSEVNDYCLSISFFTIDMVI